MDSVRLATLSPQEIFDKVSWSTYNTSEPLSDIVFYMLKEGIVYNNDGVLTPSKGIRYDSITFPVITLKKIEVCECGLDLLADGSCEYCDCWDDQTFSCEYFAGMVH